MYFSINLTHATVLCFKFSREIAHFDRRRAFINRSSHTTAKTQDSLVMFSSY